MPTATYDTNVFVTRKPAYFPAGFVMSAVVMQGLAAGAADDSGLRQFNPETGKLYEDTNKSNYVNRTCILNASGFAGNQFGDFPEEQSDHQIIIISDVLEECDETPLRRKINISAAGIS